MVRQILGGAAAMRKITWLAVFAVAAREVVYGSAEAMVAAVGVICALWLPFLRRRRP
jgi:hypothetical protein